jgi:hypothetical protein
MEVSIIIIYSNSNSAVERFFLFDGRSALFNLYNGLQAETCRPFL